MLGLARPVTCALAAAALLASRASAQDPPPAPPEPAGPPKRIAELLDQRRKPSKEPGVDAAVAAGLDWLRRHASETGGWDCDGFRCVGHDCGGGGGAAYDVGVTGLALLAFLGAGRTPDGGEDAELVRKAVQSLVAVQDGEGCVGGRNYHRFLFAQFVATTALAEACRVSEDAKLRDAAQRAVLFLHSAQNPYLAWRYDLRDGDNDTPSTVAAVLALRTAEFAGLDLDRSAYEGANAWFAKMTADGGRVGYQQRGSEDARCVVSKLPPEEREPLVVPKEWQEDPDAPAPEDPLAPRRKKFVPYLPTDHLRTEARRSGDWSSGSGLRYPAESWSGLTAGAASATALTSSPKDKDAAARIAASAAFVTAHPPRGAYVDLHYLLHGSLLDAQGALVEKPPTEPSKRRAWRSWRQVAVDVLTSSQRPAKDEGAAGSWDPDLDPWGFVGGRVYSTSMALLALQAPRRFPRVWRK